MAGIKQIGNTGDIIPPKIKQVQTQDIWLNELLEDYLSGTMKPPRPGVFHPSSLGNTCDRALWLSYNGKMVEQSMSAILNRIFQNGNFLEDRVEKWFTKLNILAGREFVVKSDVPPMSGRIDFLIRHAIHGIIPLELKSINLNGFNKLTKPKDEHQVQLQIYLNLANYEIGTVLYENKNDQKIKSFLVERDKNQWDQIVERCIRIQNMLKIPEQCTGPFWCPCKLVKETDL